MSKVEAIVNNVENPCRPLFVMQRSTLEDSSRQDALDSSTSISNVYTSDREVYGATVLNEIEFRLEAAGLSRSDLSADDAVAMDIAWSTVKEETSINVEAMLECTPWYTP